MIKFKDMESVSDFGLINLLLFTLPGFFAVWSFNKFRGKKIESDFEYAAFSFFWGLIIMVVVVQFSSEDNVNKFFDNLYATSVAFSIFAVFIGMAASGFCNKYISIGLKKIKNKWRLKK